MLTAAQAKDIPNVVEAAVIAALNRDGWLSQGVQGSGAASGQLASWTVTGATASNTDGGLLYGDLSNASTTRTVSLYKASTKQAADLVARGTRSGNGSMAIAAQNASGLSATAAVTYTADGAFVLATGLGGIKTIAAKALPLENMAVWDAVMPGIAVLALAPYEEDGDETAGAYDLVVPVVMDYYRAGAGIAANIDGCQTALARLLRWTRDETQGGTRLNALLDTGGGTTRRRAASGPDLADVRDDAGTLRGFTAAGQATFEVVVQVAD